MQFDDSMHQMYEIGCQVGQGQYAQVYKAIHKRSRRTVAIKKIYDAFGDLVDSQRTYREVSILQITKHPNIVRLLEVHEASNGLDLYCVFEYLESDLRTVLGYGLLKEVHWKFIVFQICKGLRYLHTGKVMHRDLKPENVLLVNSGCEIKIADFGLARGMEAFPTTDYVGVRAYRAPEILLGSKRYGFGVDMWALGCILAEMVLGKPIFHANSTLGQLSKICLYIDGPSKEMIEATLNVVHVNRLLKKVKKREKTLADLFPQDVQKPLLDLLQNLLVFDPRKRFTAQQTLDHPWICQSFRDPWTKEDEMPEPYREINDTKPNINLFRNRIRQFISKPKRITKRKSRFGKQLNSDSVTLTT